MPFYLVVWSKRKYLYKLLNIIPKNWIDLDLFEILSRHIWVEIDIYLHIKEHVWNKTLSTPVKSKLSKLWSLKSGNWWFNLFICWLHYIQDSRAQQFYICSANGLLYCDILNSWLCVLMCRSQLNSSNTFNNQYTMAQTSVLFIISKERGLL